MNAARSKAEHSIYSKLDPASGDFRILILAAGNEHEPLLGALVHTNLDSSTPYEALSYVWGDPTYQTIISLNGRAFNVTSNLFAALMSLRYADATRVLWIDALCINQQDLAERSDQVTRMHHIYQRATRVIIWFGRPTEHSEHAMSLLSTIARREIQASAGTSTAEDTINFQIRASFRPLSTITNNPWFSRVWIIQEIVYAEDALVICGKSTLAWMDLLTATTRIMKVVQGIIPKDAYFNKTVAAALARSGRNNDLNMMQAFMQVSRTSSLLDVLHVSRTRDATDPRDKLFGVLNLISKTEWPFPPDYSMSAVEVYTKLALHLFNTFHNLELLSYCNTGDWPGGDSHLRHEYRMRPNVLHLPSWVPDWSNMRMTVPLPDRHETRSLFNGPRGESRNTLIATRSLYRLSDDNATLTVGGSIVATVSESLMQSMTRKGQRVPFLRTVYVTMPADVRNMWLYRHLSDFVCRSSHAQSSAGGQSTTDEIRLITCGASRRNFRERRNLISVSEYETFKLASHTPSVSFFDAVFASLQARMVYATGCGLFGVGPYGTSEGDVIAVVEGCHVPLVLRPQRVQCFIFGFCREKHTDFCVECSNLDCLEMTRITVVPLRYKLIGEAYLQTRMHAPGMLGLIGGSLKAVALELV